GRVKILDFGLVRAVSDDAKLTQTGAIAGTPAYMAPEQARGDEVDSRADLFGLGCVIYQMVTGQNAFHGQGVLQILRSVEQDQPIPPEQWRPNLPPGLSSLLARLLAKQPDKRPASARGVSQMLRTIEESMDHQAVSGDSGSDPRVVSGSSQSRAWIGGGVAVLVLLAS